jgi:putative FmdB family regulatory protein
MPIYEYDCRRCNKVFEFLSWKFNNYARCPICGRRGKRRLSASNFHLKGSGFYSTDYKKPKGRVREDKGEN